MIVTVQQDALMPVMRTLALVCRVLWRNMVKPVIETVLIVVTEHVTDTTVHAGLVLPESTEKLVTRTALMLVQNHATDTAGNVPHVAQIAKYVINHQDAPNASRVTMEQPVMILVPKTVSINFATSQMEAVSIVTKGFMALNVRTSALTIVVVIPVTKLQGNVQSASMDFLA